MADKPGLELKYLRDLVLDLLMDDVEIALGARAAAGALVRVATWTDEPEERAQVLASLLETVRQEFEAYHPIVTVGPSGGEIIVGER